MVFFTCWFSVKRLGMKQKIHFKEPLDGPFGVSQTHRVGLQLDGWFPGGETALGPGVKGLGLAFTNWFQSLPKVNQRVTPWSAPSRALTPRDNFPRPRNQGAAFFVRRLRRHCCDTSGVLPGRPRQGCVCLFVFVLPCVIVLRCSNNLVGHNPGKTTITPVSPVLTMFGASPSNLIREVRSFRVGKAC